MSVTTAFATAKTAPSREPRSVVYNTAYQDLLRTDLLVIEDFGMKRLGAAAAEDLLEIFVRRHETGSTLITTNRPTEDWGTFLGDVPAATAILDRFLSHAEIITMQGKSYRMHQRQKNAPA